MAQTVARPAEGAVPLSGERVISGTHRKASYYVGRGAFWALILVILFYTLFPFYWAIRTSLSPYSELVSTPVSYWPKEIDWSHYKSVLRNDDFLKALRNSAIVSLLTVLIALAFGSLGAYAMGRLRFRGKTIALYTILSMTMFPSIAILGSLFTMIRKLGIYDTYWALIITYLTFTLPFTIWVLNNFFKAMPGELEEAALVDGATPLGAFFRILLPLAMPGLVTTGLLAFIAAWNEFLYALNFTVTYDSRTVQVAIAQFAGSSQFEEPFAVRMAASMVVTIPLIVLVLILQRKILAGLTSGAVKG